MTLGAHEIEVEVVLWRSDGGAVATLNDLATLVIRTDDERVLATVSEQIRSRTGLETAILDYTTTHLHLELLAEGDVGLRWREPLTPIEGATPWNKPGWFTAVRAQIQDSLEEAVGASQVGPMRQMKHWSVSALVEVATDVGMFWFKQVPPFMAHEGPLTTWLGALRPGAVPDVVATGPDWWLAGAFDPPSGERTLESPYGLLAEIQIEVASRTPALLALGCPDRSLSDLASGLAALAERPDVLEPELADRLTHALPRIQDLIDQIDASPIPSSLVHGDLHAGNWTRKADQNWLIFDWTDGCVAHPFFDLGVLPQKDIEVRNARLEAYLGPWRDAYGSALVGEIVDTAISLAGGFHALSYVRIVDGVDAADSNSWKPSVAFFLTALLDALQ